MYKSFDLRRRVQISEGYEEYRHLHPLHEAVKAPMLLGYPNLLASTALQLANDGLDRMLDNADVVLAREPWQASYVLDHTDETPVVFSSHNIETERFDDIHQPLFAQWVANRVDALERRAVEESDAIVCTSERDAHIYREKYDPRGPIIVAPNGTYEDDLREHRSDSEDAKQIRHRYGIPDSATLCLFMGSNYRPNVEAAEATVDIAREMRSDDFQVHFMIMGSVGNALDKSSLPANVTITGYVKDDFEAHLDAADLALNPVLSGGGTNIKLIDYFARSLPVVSTPFGVRGVDAEDGTEVIVADREGIIDAILDLSENPAKRERIGTAARQLAKRKYTWESASRTLRDRLLELFF
jgi:glycosyltransferase involved in cell wall biosynthesis